MQRKKIKINFSDFENEVNLKNNIFTDILKQRYDIEFSENPDFLFYSCFRDEYKKYKNCVKIFFTNENVVPNFNECDYAIGFDHLSFGDRYLRCPEYHLNLDSKIQDRSHIKEDLAKRKFCNFVYHNANRGVGTQLRQEFCQKLMEYKLVDCPGKVLNNMQVDFLKIDDDWREAKFKFISDYKFTVAFENTLAKGYTTEKLYQPLAANSIPIYWGNPDVAKDFNPKAFINCNDYKNFDEVINKIIELDADDEKYLQMLRENPMQSDFKFDGKAQLEEFIFNIIEKGNSPYFKSLIKWDSEGSKIFSIQNKGIYKVVNCLGLKIKIT